MYKVLKKRAPYQLYFYSDVHQSVFAVHVHGHPYIDVTSRRNCINGHNRAGDLIIKYPLFWEGRVGGGATLKRGWEGAGEGAQQKKSM